MAQLGEVFKSIGERYFGWVSLPMIMWTDIVEIIIISFLVYHVLVWIKNTRAWSLLRGIVIILVFVFLAALFDMTTILWIAIARNKAAIVEGEATLEKYRAQENQIQNSREYDAINKEIENQDLLIQIAKKRIDESKASINGLKERLEITSEKRNIIAEDLAAKEADLETIIASTAKEEEALQAKRKGCASQIDERTMVAYDRIRESNSNHLAVVGIYQGNACGGCMHIIPPQRLVEIRSGKKVVICEYCGRILVNKEQ